MGPSISVVMPTYNSATFVERGLRSIAEQTLLPSEVLVSDDGSADDTVPLAERFGAAHLTLNIRVIKNVHRGPGATRNSGIKAATSDWVAFLDSDDSWRPDKLQTVAACINADPQANFICHNQENHRLDGTVEILDFYGGYNPTRPLGTQLLWNNLFTPSAVTCRRSLLLDVGGFDEEMMSAQDYELWLKLAPYLHVKMINAPLGLYIERNGSISSGYSTRYLLNCARLLLRHRRLGPPGLACLSAIRILVYYLVEKFRTLVQR